MEIKKWNGEVEQTFYADLIHPKGGSKGSIRLVLRNPAGRIIENVLDFKPDGAVQMLKISEDNQEKLSTTKEGFLPVLFEGCPDIKVINGKGLITQIDSHNIAKIDRTDSDKIEDKAEKREKREEEYEPIDDKEVEERLDAVAESVANLK